MRKVAVDRTPARWQRLLLTLGVLIAAWGPAHSAEAAAVDHSVDHWVEGVAHAHSAGSHSVGSHDPVAAVPDRQENLDADREPGGRDDHRCGHRDAERDATQATAVRLSQPDVVSGLPVTASGDGKPRRALTDVDASRAPPGRALLVVVCVCRQ
jgi:hypothetical protein